VFFLHSTVWSPSQTTVGYEDYETVTVTYDVPFVQ